MHLPIKNKKYQLLMIAISLLAMVFFMLSANSVLAQTNAGLDEFGVSTNLGNQPLIETVANIINIILGLLGVIAIGIILYGGWLWLTSRGNEEQIAKAKKVLSSGLIGLVIILTSFAIASFIFSKLLEATGSDDGDSNWPGDLPGSREKGFNVVSVSPKHNETNVQICRVVMSVFNQEVDPASVDASSFKVVKDGGDQIDGTYAPYSNSVTFTHPIDFEKEIVYNASITTDVQNIFGKNLEKQKLWSFKTGTEEDNILPTVTLVNPAANLGDVCRNPAIQAIFSEEMNVSTLNTNNIILTNSAGVVIPLKRVAIGSDFKSFTVYPAATLASNTIFTVTLKTNGAGHPGGITDACSNPLDGNSNSTADDSPVDDYTWTFTTGENEDCHPQITNVAPVAGDYGDTLTLTGKNLGITGEISINNWWADANSFNGSDNILCWGPVACGTANETIKVKVPVDSTTGPWYPQDGYKKAMIGKIWVVLATENSNKLEFTVKSPYIDKLSPSQGGKEQFVTIVGWNFGNQPGTVKLNGVGVGPPASCSNWWRDTRIIIQIPNSIAVGGPYKVQVTTAADATSANPQVAENKNKPSNFEYFTVTSDTAGPGICEVNPDSAGLSTLPVPVTISGEKFGTTGVLKFGTTTASPSSWADTQIITNTPPTLGIDRHDVCVTVASKISNCVPFYVRDDSDELGTNPYPHVIDQQSCKNNTQSPSPYLNQTSVCTNALLSARFDKAMDATTFTTDNIKLENCGIGADASCTGVNFVKNGSFEGTDNWNIPTCSSLDNTLAYHGSQSLKPCFDDTVQQLTNLVIGQQYKASAYWWGSGSIRLAIEGGPLIDAP
ncbi:MAG: Ig-like domain-containing protein, partial [Patescibacteria group bacterium]